MDSLLPHLHLGETKPEGLSSSWKRTTLLVFAVTLHNIPEGMAVGVSFALAAQNGHDPTMYTAAMALAIGIGIQNFPEGAAISLPLRQEGLSTAKSFVLGSLSGLVELIFGVLTVLIAGFIQPLMPWLLAFAAGAMLYVVVEELIPEAHLGEHSNIGTLGVLSGSLWVNHFIQHQIKILIWFFKIITRSRKGTAAFCRSFFYFNRHDSFSLSVSLLIYFPYQSINPIGY